MTRGPPQLVEKIQKMRPELKNTGICTAKAFIVPVQDTKSTQQASFVKRKVHPLIKRNELMKEFFGIFELFIPVVNTLYKVHSKF